MIRISDWLDGKPGTKSDERFEPIIIISQTPFGFIYPEVVGYRGVETGMILHPEWGKILEL